MMLKRLLILVLLIWTVHIPASEAATAVSPLAKQKDRIETQYQKRCPVEKKRLAACRSLARRIQLIEKRITGMVKRTDVDLLRDAVIQLTNEERAKLNLPPLVFNPLLQASAQAHAIDMKERDYFSHNTPEGKEPVDRIEASGYLVPFDECRCAKSYTVGENLGKGQSSPEEVIVDWMNSPEHRENILRPEYTEIGIGILGEYWVQNFGNISLIK